MLKVEGAIHLTASDLVGHLNLTRFDLAVASGTLAKPKVWDPVLEVLAERGDLHEKTTLSARRVGRPLNAPTAFIHPANRRHARKP
jgi:hypothetical protein